MAQLHWHFGQNLPDLARSLSVDPSEEQPKRRISVELPWKSFGHGGGPEIFERKEPTPSLFGPDSAYGAAAELADYDESMLRITASGAVLPVRMRQAPEP